MSEGEVVDVVEEATQVVVEPETHSEGSEANVTHAEVEGSEDGKKEEILVEGDGSSVEVEVDGGTQEGSADSGEEEVISMESIVSKQPITKLAKAIQP